MISHGAKLILHLDVNKTVLIRDQSGGLLSEEAALADLMADCAWGEVNAAGQWKCQSKELCKEGKEGLVSYK